MTSFARCASYLRIVLLIESILVFPNPAKTEESNPLRPVDTSSPRATMQSFVGAMDADSDEVAQAIRDDVAQGSEMISPKGRSLAGG